MLPGPRWADEFVQLVVRRRGTRSGRPVVFLRAVPSTARSPTPAQARARRELGRVARSASGSRGLAYDPETGRLLPAAALAVKRAMKDRSFGGRPRPKKWELVLRRYFEEAGVPWEEARRALLEYFGSKSY
jgi:hypothetical protein